MLFNGEGEMMGIFATGCRLRLLVPLAQQELNVTMNRGSH
jgi:hypothetical protein